MSSYEFKLAKTTAELKAYFQLRHFIFVEEQQLFASEDIDEYDSIAYPIVAVTLDSTRYETADQGHQTEIQAENQAEHQTENQAEHPTIVGVVRIYEVEPGLWYGGRLGTAPQYRRGWQIGKGLIDKAVTTAHSWGCQQFLATVQQQNVRFFQRLHWQSLEEITIRGRLHHLMQADLTHYPANGELRVPQPWQKVC